MVVVAVSADNPERDGVQPRGFRREVRPRRVGAAHDEREPRQRRIALEPEHPSMVSKRAARALMLSSTPSMSNGTPPVSSRDRRHFRRIDVKNSRVGSMKRRISHGQATRSIFGRRRVTHRLGRRWRERSSAAARDQRQAGRRPGRIAAGQHAGVETLRAQLAATILARSWPALQAATTGRARSSEAQPRGRLGVAPDRGRQDARGGLVNVAAAHVDEQRRRAVPMRARDPWERS